VRGTIVAYTIRKCSRASSIRGSVLGLRNDSYAGNRTFKVSTALEDGNSF